MAIGKNLRRDVALVEKRIIRWHTAIIGDAQHLSGHVIEVLGPVRATPLSRCDVKRAIRGEDEAGTEMSPAA